MPISSRSKASTGKRRGAAAAPPRARPDRPLRAPPAVPKHTPHPNRTRAHRPFPPLQAIDPHPRLRVPRATPQKPPPNFRRLWRSPPPPIQPWPEHGHKGSENQYEGRIGRLKQSVIDRGIHKIPGQEIERGYSLQTEGPEYDHRHEEQQHSQVTLGLHPVPPANAAYNEIQDQENHDSVHGPFQHREKGQQQRGGIDQHTNNRQRPQGCLRPWKTKAAMSIPTAAAIKPQW